MKKWMLILTLSLAMMATGCETLYKIAEEAIAVTGDPTDTEIVGGLKEALSSGAANAVSLLSQKGGYGKDPLIRIPFPSEAQFAANALRDIGLGRLVDTLEARLNDGAEKGARMALPIFRDAITQMTFADARNILLGSENAATIYFQDKTREQLLNAFAPHIKNSLDEVHATEIWTEITTRYNSIPLVRKKIDTDLVRYATGRALDGLFAKLALEEKKIREQPLARSTALLQKVFSYADRQKPAGGN
jgi:hypothetical protein